MKTKESFDVSHDDWVEYPESSGLDAAFMTNESSRGITMWYQLSESKPTYDGGHTLHESDWVSFDTKDGSSLWLKSKKEAASGEVARVSLSS